MQIRIFFFIVSHFENDRQRGTGVNESFTVFRLFRLSLRFSGRTAYDNPESFVGRFSFFLFL